MQASGRVPKNYTHTYVLWWKITGWSGGRQQHGETAAQQPGLVCLSAVCPQGLVVQGHCCSCHGRNRGRAAHRREHTPQCQPARAEHGNAAVEHSSQSPEKPAPQKKEGN